MVGFCYTVTSDFCLIPRIIIKKGKLWDNNDLIYANEYRQFYKGGCSRLLNIKCNTDGVCG